MLKNLTPHVIVIRPGDEEVVLPPSGQVARVSVSAKELYKIAFAGIRVPVVRTEFGDIVDLPDPDEGVIYVTSTLVAQAAAARGRTDVVAPDTSPESAVRDQEGRIVAVRRLQTFA